MQRQDQSDDAKSAYTYIIVNNWIEKHCKSIAIKTELCDFDDVKYQGQQT